ncbi:FAD-dependent pyridine nucleotide-disulphide oxidoreductase [Chryseobacterium sp. StRB126]|uniref:hypothetical protein n=1 Tax=Chryseobacterium sp. StRB126 TaxID=878220 RepID=UPI0004E98271|nr:hypothetical protein [Chryseobacterium sp. StRB126]BAP32956.1 FAD-dependent pyridine nucleotide-disulphide oxidoreductase [Chryseobacterium sp. StRB126]
MKSIPALLCGLLFSVSIHGQAGNSAHGISTQDKILLQEFWKDFADAVIRNDKAKLETLCEFPFYCRPCLDYLKSKNSNLVTVKVAKELFYKEHYKIFFEKELKAEVRKHQKFTIQFFHPYFNEEMKQHGISFLYTLVPPSEHWEGTQGMITLRKTEGKFKITGIDVIP